MYWKLAITGIAALAIGSSIYLGYAHYTDLLEANSVLRENNVKLEVSVALQKDAMEAQRDAIYTWETSQRELLERVDELQQTATSAATETRRLNDIFAKHDFTDLARRKPGLIERRVNTGTRDLQRMLECASGARRADCTDDGGPPAGPPPAP
jgi:hypothetical protein